MSFFGKLMFWRREEPEFGLGGDLPPLPGETEPYGGLGGPYGKSFSNGSSPSRLTLEPVSGFEPELNRPSFLPVSTPSFTQVQPAQSHSDIMMNKNMEIISSKLDALQASLESINQRLINIERIANAEQQQSYQKQNRMW